MPWKTVKSVADLNPAGVESPSSFGRGLSDPISGLAQIAEQVLPESISGGINQIDNFLFESTNGLLGNPEATFREGLAVQEADFQQQRAAAGETGIDFARIGGNLAGTLPAALAGPAAAATLPGRIAQGVAGGGLFAATQPVGEGDFLKQKAEQVGAGTIGGGVAAPLLGAASRVVQPQVKAGIKKLMGEGITPSPGQILGGAAKSTEEKLRSIPLLGDMITNANRAAGTELNVAAYNRALAPIGKSADKFPVGREGVKLVKEALNKAYNTLLPKLKFQSDPQFSQSITALQTKIGRELEPKFKRLFDNALEDKVTSKLTTTGRMNGTKLKAAEEDLGKLSRKFLGGSSASERSYGEALDELKSIVRDTVVRSSPDKAAELKAINEGYANYVIIRDAAKRAGAQEGFSPAQLSAAVINQDKSVGRGATATGKALMQDLSDPGTNFLTSRYPDSGSIGRGLLATLGLAGAGTIDMAIPGAAIGAGALFTRPAQKVIAGIMTQRPEGAAKLADAIRKTSPLGGLLAEQSLEENSR